MRKTVTLLSLVAVGMTAGVVLLAQGQKRVSPHETVTEVFGGKKISIEYGRPYKKGREIFGGLVPFGKVWRTGADEATVLTTEADLMVGSIHVPKGSYSLFTIPDQSSWMLILNKVAKQWGAYKYEESQDLGRTKLEVSQGPEVEQLTIDISKTNNGKGAITMKWDKTIAVAPIMVH